MQAVYGRCGSVTFATSSPSILPSGIVCGHGVNACIILPPSPLWRVAPAKPQAK